MTGLRERVRAGRVVGTFLKLPGTAAVAMAQELFDFAVVDREHSALSEAEALAIVAHGAALGFPVLVRVPDLDAGEVNRALEMGAAGIQLSQVRSPEGVYRLREACEYPPHGRRSVSVAHPSGRYGAVPLREYVDQSAGEALVVAQIESVLSPDAYRAILEATPDVAFIGVTDLTVDCRFDEAAVAGLIDAVAAAAQDTGVPLGAFGLEDRAQVRYLVVSSDAAMLRSGMAAARGRAGHGQPTGGKRT